MIEEIKKCRICGNTELETIINLGNQALTGHFPRTRSQEVLEGPLELVKCSEAKQGSCGLVQLKHSFNVSEMYGENYGYRSGLNRSMVQHLHGKVNRLLKLIKLNPKDLVIDIGSNDSTLLQGYPQNIYQLVGIDPTGKKFEKYYPDSIQLIPDFFSKNNIELHVGKKKAKIITSISMFYDLEDPVAFMQQIHDVLDNEGVWVFEQSYLPTMINRNSYDTVCHEHLEYYCLKQIKWMADKIGFKIIDIELNDINGGSFSITVARKDSAYLENNEKVDLLLRREQLDGYHTTKPFIKFDSKIKKHRSDFVKFLNDIKESGKTIVGYGASTKGNVILQYCGITEDLLPCIAEVNEDKFGCFTPGTKIPILSEKEIRKQAPDYMLVLPWHFKDNIVLKEKQYLESGGILVMPLPEIELVELANT